LRGHLQSAAGDGNHDQGDFITTTELGDILRRELATAFVEPIAWGLALSRPAAAQAHQNSGPTSAPVNDLRDHDGAFLGVEGPQHDALQPSVAGEEAGRGRGDEVA